MTFNIKGYFTLDRPEGVARVAREIALHDPDILVLQDATDLAQLEQRSPGALRALFGDLKAFAHGQYVVAARNAPRDCVAPEGRPGKRRHGLLHCVVEAQGRELDVITTHLMTPRDALGAMREGDSQAAEAWEQNLAERTEQAEAVAARVRASRRPTIVAGDLNAPETSLVVRTLLEAGLRGAFSSAGRGFGYTWGHSLRPGLSFLRIDHVLVSPGIGVAACFTGGAEASPHRPVIADLHLQPDAR
jgi:endonuclease/exonuclease/phosphatase family metal-dependent hydrolase